MITEKLIISQQKLDEVNKMDRTERIKTIKSILSDPKYIPNQSQLKNYLTYLVKEVDARGFDTVDNPLLIFATNNKGRQSDYRRAGVFNTTTRIKEYFEQTTPRKHHILVV